MSAGAFTDNAYTTDGGITVAIRTQPETVNPWNPAVNAAITPGLPSAQVGKGRNTIGINARIARFEWFTGVPANYDPNGVITLPIFTQTAFQALVKKTDYAYQGGTLRLVGKTSEKIR